MEYNESKGIFIHLEVAMKRDIFLLYGGKSTEHQVSIQTAFSVIRALDFNKYRVTPIYITEQGGWVRREALTAPVEHLAELKAPAENGNHPSAALVTDSLKVEEFQKRHRGELPIVFPLLHGTNGEDGTVQGLLEVLNLPYVGNGVMSSAVGMDKIIMKNLFAQAGLNQVRYVYFHRYEWEKDPEAAYDKVAREVGFPCFVKPANCGSSVGISKVKNRNGLAEAFKEAFQFDRKIIIEEGVRGREIEIGVLGNNDPICSVAGEIVPKAEFYDYQAKYEDEDTALIIPADIPQETYETIKEMAIAAFRALDCSGLVRADFFLKENGEVLINEVNTMPGFTPVSMYPLLWKHTGLDYPDLIDRLIELGYERYKEKQNIRYTLD